ncbi:MAG: hypothetical protein P8X55_21395 [Desulfosarcinaceae bacterium]
MGQKPLYYQTDCRRMACASELGALSASAMPHGRPCPHRAAAFIRSAMAHLIQGQRHAPVQFIRMTLGIENKGYSAHVAFLA